MEKIKQNQFLREYVEEQLNLRVPPPYVKPPKRGTVLGNVKETIRFNDSHFISASENDVTPVIDSISFGFGEKGYYYDINLNHDEIEASNFGEIIAELLEFLPSLEETFETRLLELYYDDERHDSAKHQMFELSNFQATVEDDGVLERNFGLIHSITQIINKKSDIVVEEGNNFGLPEISIDIYNDYIFKSLDLFREKAKPLSDQRFFTVRKLLSVEGRDWVFASRGIPLDSIVEILSLCWR